MKIGDAEYHNICANMGALPMLTIANIKDEYIIFGIDKRKNENPKFEFGVSIYGDNPIKETNFRTLIIVSYPITQQPIDESVLYDYFLIGLKEAKEMLFEITKNRFSGYIFTKPIENEIKYQISVECKKFEDISPLRDAGVL
jgi:hypothetical protein